MNSLHFKRVMSMKLCFLGLYSKKIDSQNAQKMGLNSGKASFVKNGWDFSP